MLRGFVNLSLFDTSHTIRYGLRESDKLRDSFIWAFHRIRWRLRRALYSRLELLFELWPVGLEHLLKHLSLQPSWS